MERCLSHMYYQWKNQGDNQDASCYTKGGVIQICLIIPETILDEYVKLNSEWCRGVREFLFPFMSFHTRYFHNYELLLKNNFLKT